MEKLNISLPQEVQKAIAQLEKSGFQAYIVGGCVRNTLLCLPVNDWDMTTSARPEEMKQCFADFRTIETGIQHGTLTVLVEGMPLEITTFRNDGEYLDNRHPVGVTFSQNIEEDLCRRDFTVNAMAYHPERGLVDLFGGQKDLQKRVIACVGEPEKRFYEDGLRILRALRFAAVLDFSIDTDTEKAIHNCRHLLENIAAERIREEFCKLICGVGAVRILREYHDVIGIFLPELEKCFGFAQNSKYHCYDVFEHTMEALLEAPPHLITRLSVLLHDIGKPLCYTEDENGGHFKGHGDIGTELTRNIMKRLRFDNQTSLRVTRLVEYHDRDIPATERSVKRLMNQMSDEDISIFMEVKRCDRLAHAALYRELSPALTEIPRLVKEIRAKNACLSLKDLKVGGNDLMELGIPKGKEIGRILNALLDRVLDEELPNEKEALLAAVKDLREE